MDHFRNRRRINIGIVLATFLSVAVLSMMIGSAIITKKMDRSEQPSQQTTRAR
jgi:hypothetical protein